MLKLQPEHLEQLHLHAHECYPEECCGLMLGQRIEDVVQVVQLWRTENSWTADFLMSESSKTRTNLSNTNSKPSRLNRFAIAPIEILRAQKYARNENLEIIGIYHSHPDHPAIPSEYDRQIAWQMYSYLIMSVTAQQVSQTLSWRLNDEQQFQEEPVAIADK
ncbi:Mov34/MPN/PAD-1 family protein [[Leptolyngbya] sp. PCC 7376]|uniref:M67 family metallopeptidase n=1 Tax=[Leptolyngbya] sp. PCC 7376 TaxID=111781 RepID=UPI00029EC598|nr:M67 family metallopeptidase [[Leptolyngbya] sp. PCC 7376]AFY40532.1 Mov34/MPN/PAD-1 family protein [[Leptolyngbya] sp. PCC 7376]